jgi:hypothetical protein
MATTKKVNSVTSVNARFVPLNKVSIMINAVGTTTTNGWTNPQLKPVVYVQPPLDKTWEFSFQADEPEGGSDVITPIKASYQWNNPPGNVEFVRVVAETNKVVEKVK